MKSGGEGSLPALDPALVEECAKVWCVTSPSIPKMSGNGKAALRAALNHYRERVEKPLRDVLDDSLEQVGDLIAQRDDVLAEADRLRGELTAARAGGFIK